ncbi:MAG: DUF3253 domain-containing protein [Polyangiales bacterium]
MTEPDEDDARYLRIDGRRWRRSDPGIPEALRSELTHALMDARRAVKAAKRAEDAEAERTARARVNDAKIALGERGAPWWEPGTEVTRATRAAAVMRSLLDHRGADKSICPSEVARVLAGDAFRTRMAEVRALVEALEAEDALEVRQKGVRVSAKTARGPIRIARAKR